MIFPRAIHIALGYSNGMAKISNKTEMADNNNNKDTVRKD